MASNNVQGATNRLHDHERASSDLLENEMSEASIGYDFEDHQTRQQLELIDDLQKLGVSNYLDLPQLVVVGDQNTGKSSVLQAVTEIPFIMGDNMCTRFATEVILQRTAPDDRTKITVEIIPDADETLERREELNSWRPARFDELATLDKATMKDIFEQADKMIFGTTSKENSSQHEKRAKVLSNDTLRITRSGPKEINFGIVDIPGLVRGKSTDPNYRTAKTLVEKYLGNPRSIIVAVIDITDIERHAVIPMLKDIPDEESRVIGVVNKCDMKFRKAHEFVFDLIRNRKEGPSPSEYYLREGWYGLRNRQASEEGISDDERDKRENEFFSGPEWNTLDRNKLGRHALKSALIQMRNRHVKRSIPSLMSEIQRKLDECLVRIEQLGDPRQTNHAQFSAVNKVAARYSERAGGAINGHYESLSDDKQFARKRVRDDLDVFQSEMAKKGLLKEFVTSDRDAELVSTYNTYAEWATKLLENPTYSWIRSSIKTYRGNEEVGEINQMVKAQLWKKQISSWEKISSEALEQIERTVEEVNASLFEEACPDKNLRLKLQTWLQDDFQKAAQDARVELQQLISSERDGQLFSLHPNVAKRKQQFREARIQAILGQCIIKNSASGLPQAANIPLKVGSIEPQLVVQSLLDDNPELIGVLNTHDSLAAYYEVALYRFMDNFALQVVERHLLGPHGPLRLFSSDYVTEKLHEQKNEAELNRLAGEDPKIVDQRAKLERERASLEASKRRVQSFKIL